MNNLDINLNYVVFKNTAKPISDFDIEKTYQRIKDIKCIEISNSTLLARFCLGVKEKEIEPFNCVVHDIDGEVYSCICEENGELSGDVWKAKILGLYTEYCFRIIM